jgi:hypothetical protein
MFYAKGLAAGPREIVEEWTGQADFENDCIINVATFDQKVPECISLVAPNLSVSLIYRTAFRPKKRVLYGEIAITA